MKSVIFGLAVLFLSPDSSAQQEKPLPKVNTTYEDPLLAPFEGEWATKNRRSGKIRFYLRKETRTYQGNISADVLTGYHDFEKNGKKVDSSFEWKDSGKKGSLMFSRTGRPNELGGYVTEQSGKRSMMLATYHPASETLVVTLHEPGGLTINQPRRERVLPEKFVLKKVK